MDYRQEIQKFLSRHQTTGWLILLMVGGFVLQGILLLIFTSLGMKDGYQVLMNNLVLPVSLQDWLTQPWSILTYPFFMAKIDIFGLLISGLIIWAFGRIHQQLLGDIKTRRLVILAVPLIGILSITTSSFMNYEPVNGPINPTGAANYNQDSTNNESDVPRESRRFLEEEEVKETTRFDDEKNSNNFRVGGFMPVIMVLVISCITLVPSYPIQLFLFGQVKIVWVGIILLIIEIASALGITPLALAIAFGALLGFSYIYLLNKGTDITDIIWSYYQDARSKPKMKVKYGEKTTKGKEASTSSRPNLKGSVSQEEIDKILDKINAKGYESLSREEKEALFKASSQKDDDK
jgi:hypothetical protein